MQKKNITTADDICHSNSIDIKIEAQKMPIKIGRECLMCRLGTDSKLSPRNVVPSLISPYYIQLQASSSSSGAVMHNGQRMGK